MLNDTYRAKRSQWTKCFRVTIAVDHKTNAILYYLSTTFRFNVLTRKYEMPFPDASVSIVLYMVGLHYYLSWRVARVGGGIHGENHGVAHGAVGSTTRVNPSQNTGSTFNFPATNRYFNVQVKCDRENVMIERIQASGLCSSRQRISGRSKSNYCHALQRCRGFCKLIDCLRGQTVLPVRFITVFSNVLYRIEFWKIPKKKVHSLYLFIYLTPNVNSKGIIKCSS